VERILRRCLVKDPEERWQSARDLLWELKNIPAAPVAARSAKSRPLGWIAAGVFALVAAAAWLWRPAPEARVVQVSIAPPEKTALLSVSGSGVGGHALSPDGRSLVFAARSDSDGSHRLWIRPLHTLAARPLPGTEGGYFPFWSPDGRAVAFFAQDKLKRIDVAGGPPHVICDVPLARGGSWSRDGVILFAALGERGIRRVSAAGGTPVAVTEPDPARQEVYHYWPEFLPDGRHFIFFARSGENRAGALFVESVDATPKSSRRSTLGPASSNAVYSAGHLLFFRERSLLAQRFDPNRRELEGEASLLAEDAGVQSAMGRADLSASSAGALTYASSHAERNRLVWMGR
ncbi:MAG: hypothetical protein ACRD96_11970, partial [Bryobacteraceae bacterium]